MPLLEDLAEQLARDALAQAEEKGDEKLVDDVAKALGASSTTMQQTYLTAIRFYRAEARGRSLLEARAARPETTDTAPDTEAPTSERPKKEAPKPPPEPEVERPQAKPEILDPDEEIPTDMAEVPSRPAPSRPKAPGSSSLPARPKTLGS